MGASRFVGRVGVLAVALGVGAGITLGVGTAWADDSPGTSTTSSGSHKSAPRAKAPKHDAPAQAAAPAAAVKDAPKAVNKHRSAKPTSTAVPSAAVTPSAPKTLPAPKATVGAVSPSAPAPTAAVAATPSQSAVSAVVAASAVSVAAVAPVSAVSSVGATASGALSALFGGSGGVPAAAPVSWVLAAAARRELGAVAVAGTAVTNHDPKITAVSMVPPQASNGTVLGLVKATDADKDSLTYSISGSSTGTSAKGGSVYVVSTNGLFTYTPTLEARNAAAVKGAPSSAKTDTFTVTVTDAQGNSVSQLVTVKIGALAAGDTTPTSPNRNPKISWLKMVAPDASGTVYGFAAASDADKDSLTFSIGGSSTGTSANGGDVHVFGVTGLFSYTPTQAAQHAAAVKGAPSSAKTDTFTLTVTDGQGGSVSKDVTVKVLPANKVPVKVDPTVNAPDANGVVTGTLNVTDADGDTLTYTASKAKNGTVSVAGDGSFTYTPTAKAMHAASVPGAKPSALTDVFTVKVTDGHGGSVTQTVPVTIKPANTDPVVASGLVATKTNGSSGVVNGATTITDADKDTIKYTATALKGKVTVSSKGVFTYTPSAAARHAASADGATAADKTDTVTVTADDGHGGVVSQQVDVSIISKNSAPSASVKVGKADAATGVVTGTVKGTDADKDSLTYSVSGTSTKGGAVTVNATTGAFTYTPTVAARDAAAAKNAPKAAKTDTFTVSIADGHGPATNKVVTVTISPKAAPANTSPTNGHASVNAPDAATGVVTGTLSATDAENDPLTFTTPATTAKGTVVISGTGFVYTPTAAARQQAGSGTATATDKQDTFTVTVSDGRGGSSTFAVNVTVAPAVSVPTTVNNLGTATVSGSFTTAAISADGKRAVVLSTNADGNAVVTMFNTNTGARVGDETVLEGSSDGTVQFNSTSTRAVVVTNDANSGNGLVSVFSTATGAQVGTTIDLGGVYSSYSPYVGAGPQSYYGGGPAQFTSDGTRALVIAFSSVTDDSADQTTTTSYVHLINLTAGTDVYSTSMQGLTLGTLSTDGTVAAISAVPDQSAYTTYTEEPDGSSSTNSVNYSSASSSVVFLNTATGAPIGSTLHVTGVVQVGLNTDGSRAVISALTGTAGGTFSNSDNGESLTLSYHTDLTDKITVVNTATGIQAGNAVTFANLQPMQLLITPDGARAVVTLLHVDVNGAPSSFAYQSQVAIFDMATGNQVGSTFSISGAPESYSKGQLVIGVQLVAGGTRALLVTHSGSSIAGSTVTWNAALIDTATGLQVGQTLATTGLASVDMSADGMHIGVSSATYTVTTDQNGTVTGATINWTQSTILDAISGHQASVTIPGFNGGAALSSDGSRMVVATSDGTNLTLTTFDMATGAAVGAPVVVTGVMSAAAIAMYQAPPVKINGDYVTAATTVGDSTTHVAFIDANTGSQIGTTTEVDGQLMTNDQGDPTPTVVTDGTHALVFTLDPNGSDTDVTLLSLT